MLRPQPSVVVLFPIIVCLFIAIQVYKFSGSAPIASVHRLGSSILRPSRSTTASKWNNLIRLGSTQPVIGKCTVAFGNHNDGYRRALETHLAHSDYHGYPTYLLDHRILDGLWSKEAALLDVMLEQLSRPAGERLEWLVWFDADTLVMNKLVPLELFLPPEGWDEVHLLYTKDWNGLNNGVFFLRVSDWSLELLSSILAFRTFFPDEDLPFTEQSAMGKIIQMGKYHEKAVQCPPQWFNAYPSDGGELDVHYDHRPGQFLVHFAGVGDKSKAIEEWLEKLEVDRRPWEMPIRETNYEQQVQAFWDGLREEREQQQKLQAEEQLEEPVDGGDAG